MCAIIEELTNSIALDIQCHPAWIGHIPGLTGLQAEKMLRGKKTPYLYVVRPGECDGSYYITFVHRDLTVRHQPFVITETVNGWCYENATAGGPYNEINIDLVLHLIMHCESDEAIPYIVN